MEKNKMQLRREVRVVRYTKVYNDFQTEFEVAIKPNSTSSVTFDLVVGYLETTGCAYMDGTAPKDAIEALLQNHLDS